MLSVIFGDELDWRFALLIKTMIIFNVIPVILLLLYVLISGIVIYCSALLLHLFSFLFGLAIFAPVMVFSSLSAIIFSFIIIISRPIFLQENKQAFGNFINCHERLKME